MSSHAACPERPKASRVGAVILAGGEGSRLVRDKGCLCVGGQPIVTRVVNAAREVAADRVVIVGDAPLPPGLNVPVVPDAIPSGGPVQALHVGLQAMGTPLVVLLAWDMPFVSPALLLRLVADADGYDAAVPQAGDRAQPLHAVYSQACAAAIADVGGGRNASMRALLERLRVRSIDEDAVRAYGDPGRLFLSVNTADDLHRARRLSAAEEHLAG